MGDDVEAVVERAGDGIVVVCAPGEFLLLEP
ncbi:hypothetical protein CLV40_11625 [Actinokineospora auranticolor]|uniref:Uncharacterized protein n=1 Tax=Actinokineospora auranticolor TaxID=155976 RepID=A0A2S6GIG8_9PSEU|nr:hypothetical protein CLV40_11625 [Actinokineospora auranticolor]